MEQDKKVLLGSLAGMALTTGLAVVTQGSGSIILSVVNGIASNLASSFIEKTEYGKIKKLLGSYDPSELNHDLKKLIINSVIWAVKNIEILYKKQLTDKHEINNLNATIDQLIQVIKIRSTTAIQSDSEWLHLTERSNDADAMLEQFKITAAALPVINEKSPFNTFLQTHFAANLKLCFGELLKSPRNMPAYIAYQRQVYSDINKRIDQLQASPQRKEEEPTIEVLRKVQNHVRAGSNKDRTKYLNKALDQYLAPVHRDVQLLVDITSDISHDVKEIKYTTSTFEKKLKENWISKHKTIVGILSVILIIVIASLAIYIYRQPFNGVLFLEKRNGLHIDPLYPVTDPNSTIIIEFPEGRKNYDLNKSLSVLLTDIPASYKNKYFRIRLQDPYWELCTDSVVLNKSVKLNIQPNETLARIKGVVRTRDGNDFIAGAEIKIPGDTIFYSDDKGLFDVLLSEQFRKPEYKLIISVPGYASQDDARYYPGTAPEFRMEKLK